jgi:uncharacterized protein YfbU (UPF0304 family)
MSYACAYAYYMATMTIRLDDRTQEELTAIARAQGVTLSELARRALMTLLTNTDADAERSGQAPVPVTMTTVERAQLALLHRILGHLSDGTGDEGDRDHQVKIAETLEEGYTSEYDNVFRMIETELSRQETAFVMDVLDMFEALEASFPKLSEAEQKSLGEYADFSVTFRGFDANSRREGRLRTYAQRLIEEGRWAALADRFDRAHDRGNSHHPMAERYERMVAEFNPMWREKLRLAGGRRDAYLLSRDELAKVLAAEVHPSNR